MTKLILQMEELWKIKQGGVKTLQCQREKICEKKINKKGDMAC